MYLSIYLHTWNICVALESSSGAMTSIANNGELTANALEEEEDEGGGCTGGGGGTGAEVVDGGGGLSS